MKTTLIILLLSIELGLHSQSQDYPILYMPNHDFTSMYDYYISDIKQIKHVIIMNKQFYFKYIHSEICYDSSYFIEYMKEHNLNEIEVYKAIPDKFNDGSFWCKHGAFCGDDSSLNCGKICNNYIPKNGKNGCCKHYTNTLYVKGEKVILKLKNIE